MNLILTADRQALAKQILGRLAEAGFIEESVPKHWGRVFYRFVDATPIRVRVFTRIFGYGDDAQTGLFSTIAVETTYRTKRGVDQHLLPKQILRFPEPGGFDAFCEKLLSGMRRAYAEGRRVARCDRCSAPVRITKKGHLCTEQCYLS